MTPQSLIPDIRRILKDDDAVAYRYNDDTLRTAIVRAARRISIFRPDLFIEIGEVSTTNNEVLQSVPNNGRIMEVFRVKDGNAVRESTREVLDQLVPDWPTHSAGPCTDWMRHNRDPSQFFIYPKSPAVQTLVAQYTVSPADYELADTIPLADKYEPLLVECAVAEIEWGDDEHLVNRRADAFYQRALQALQTSNQTKPMTDLEESGGDPKQVS